MAAFPSYADYADYDGDGISRRPRRIKRAPNVPLPGPTTPTADPNIGPPDPYAVKAPVPAPTPNAGPPLPTFDRAYNAQADAATGPPTPVFPPGPGINPRVGTPTAGLNRTGRKLAEIQTMQDADQASKIHKTDWGYEVDPPEQSPSRFRQALMGALQGALAGASQTGTLAGALGGAGTGAVAGGVSPRMVLALKRDQDIRRAQGQLSDDLKLEGAQAKVEGEWASTDYTRARPDIEMAEVRRKRQEDIDTLEQRRIEEYGRMSREEMQDARAKLDREGRKEVAHIRAGATSNSSTGVAAEGAEEERQASRSIEEVKARIDHLTNYPGEGTLEGRRSIAQKEAMWRTEAARRYKEALDTYVQGVDAKPEIKDFYEQVRAEDPDFQSGTYDQTVRSTEAKEKELEELRKELTNLQKERRGGAAKSKRSSGSKSSNTTHGFSISAFLKSNPGATEEDARAYAAEKYPGYQVIP